MTRAELVAAIKSYLKGREGKKRSAWSRGVDEYVDDIVIDIETNWGDDEGKELTEDDIDSFCFGGASSAFSASRGGNFLIWDGDIARRLCTPSELRKSKNGLLNPNGRESWNDVQTRAIYQANLIVKNIWRRSI